MLLISSSSLLLLSFRRVVICVFVDSNYIHCSMLIYMYMRVYLKFASLKVRVFIFIDYIYFLSFYHHMLPKTGDCSYR